MNAIRLLFCILGFAGLLSCKTQPENSGKSKEIVLLGVGDRFLQNFITAERTGLSISITRNDALFAGATIAGYTELERQVERINLQYDSQDYEYWKQEVQRRQVLTKTAASYEGAYDKYNVLECDKFLENFVYAENGKISLEIAENEAVLCGATREGYRTISGDVAELNRMVQDGEVTYNDVKESFDSKQDYIIRSATSKIPVKH